MHPGLSFVAKYLGSTHCLFELTVEGRQLGPLSLAADSRSFELSKFVAPVADSSHCELATDFLTLRCLLSFQPLAFLFFRCSL